MICRTKGGGGGGGAGGIYHVSDVNVYPDRRRGGGGERIPNKSGFEALSCSAGVPNVCEAKLFAQVEEFVHKTHFFIQGPPLPPLST